MQGHTLKRIILLSIALLFASGLRQIALAQEAELDLYTKITGAIEAKEPEWKLNRKALLPNQVIIRWSSEKGRVLVAVALFPSESDAAEAFKSKVDDLEHAPESKVSKKALKDFGEAGYILKNGGGSGASIVFRKGSHVVQIYGPTENVARSFSKHIVELLPTSNNHPGTTLSKRSF